MKLFKKSIYHFSTIASAVVFLGPVSLWAAKVKVIPNEQAALQIRYDLIRSAKNEILIEYFEIDNDDISKGGLALLQEASRRGVKVKILLDNMHSQLTRAQYSAVLNNFYPLTVKQNLVEKNENIDIKLFNPVTSLNLLDQTYRNHDKLFVVDGETAIIGGRNVSGSYFKNASPGKANLRDVDIVVQGSEVKDAEKYFLNLWQNNSHVKEAQLFEFSIENMRKACALAEQDNITGCEMAKESVIERAKKAQSEFDKIIDDINQNRNSKVAVKGNPELMTGFVNVNLAFMYNDPQRVMAKVENRLGSQIIEEILKIKPTTISIVTPYLFPTDHTLDAFQSLISGQNTKVRILTNSLRSTDSPLVYAAYLSKKPRMMEMGIDLYEYKGSESLEIKANEIPEILHAKLMVLNESSESPTIFIGSFNFDHRSAYINREVGVKIFGGDVQKLTQEIMKHVNEIGRASLPTVKDGQEVQGHLKQLLEGTPPKKIEKAESMKGLVMPLRRHI